MNYAFRSLTPAIHGRQRLDCPALPVGERYELHGISQLKPIHMAAQRGDYDQGGSPTRHRMSDHVS